MSAKQLLDVRRSLGYLPSRAFYIFGNPTKYRRAFSRLLTPSPTFSRLLPPSRSPSPSMHNAAFAANGCAHTYGVCETDEPDELIATLSRSGAGGERRLLEPSHASYGQAEPTPRPDPPRV